MNNKMTSPLSGPMDPSHVALTDEELLLVSGGSGTNWGTLAVLIAVDPLVIGNGLPQVVGSSPASPIAPAPSDGLPIGDVGDGEGGAS